MGAYSLKLVQKFSWDQVINSVINEVKKIEKKGDQLIVLEFDNENHE